ncbi:hypothetical protein F5Y17DRAFT_462242 [Xylariaceae sp. FL0594]|nr:hypothetical protein F5Y17DRAFT_462242 [Xylariaceae sp. FL0594]
MGADTRRPLPLPAPTESESFATPTEVAPSELSNAADEESHYSLPDDGTPVTIRTRGHRASKSQTSLLIEYFEGGKSSTGSGGGSRVTDRKPSVRVRLTPSKARGKNDHIQITETRSRRASQSRRATTASPNISRSELDMTDPEDGRSLHSYASATEESIVSRNPIEVEIDSGSSHVRRRRKPSSPLIPAADSKSSSYMPPNMSDISAIPTDSFLDGSGPSNTLRDDPYGTRPLGNAPVGAANDKVNRKPRPEVSDQIASQKTAKSDRKHRSKNRSSGGGEKEMDVRDSSRRRSKGNPKESVVSAAESSVLSQVTPSHRSYDSHSSSKISINNPKLLETVEDAIRRLILPELDALKRERSQRDSRKPKDRESLSSLTSVSREEISVIDKRRSVDTTKSTKSRDREARNDISPHSSIDQLSYVEDGQDDNATPRRSRDIADAASGAVVATAALRSRSQGDEKRQRRRRRAETPKREHMDMYANEEEEEDHHEPVPPMPLSSEINPSEMTRTSILSATTDRPHSASEQMMPVREVARGQGSMESMDGAATRTRTPVNTTLHNLGAQHANVSHGDLRALPRKGAAPYQEEYDDEQHRNEYYAQNDAYDDDYDESGHLAEPGMYDDEHEYYGSQDVPAPLRYVPYQQERRGLSPIQSVSGYTEGESELQGHRDSRIAPTVSEVSSPSKSPHHERDLRTSSSIPSNMRSREFGDDGSSVRSSGLGYRNTVYTENSEIGPVTSAQAVKVISGNPQLIHQNYGPESAVASLVDPSLLSGSLSAGQSYKDSHVSYDGNANETHAGVASPAQRSLSSTAPVDQASALSREQGSALSHEYTEYELNEFGQKVPQSARRTSPTTSESAITTAALNRAAAIAKKKNDHGSPEHETETNEGEFVPEGVSRNRSFKERAKNGYRLDATPRHSADRLYDNGQPQLTASALPDFNNPEPEIGYSYEDDLSERRTPSATDERDERHYDYNSQWDRDGAGPDRAVTPRAGKTHDIDALEAAAATLATAGAMAHSRQPSQEHEDDWQQRSGDRKRDTIVTNPYEGASPIANLPGIDGNMLGQTSYGNSHYGAGFHTGSPGLGAGDEGYISAAPNEGRDNVNRNGKEPALPPPTLGPIDDPFYAPEDLRLSGMSQGMQTPLYDRASGTGIDRIQSSDIIALMEHLMVRDAQRSARDTEILVTLVRSAAEMRNSFDDIKKMLADTEAQIVGEVNDNTEKSLKRHLGGPRPFPGSSARSVQMSQSGTEDMPAKKRNLLRRALQGLSAKGTNDLSRIEDMLVRLLTDVDVLKHQTTAPGMMSTRAHSLDNIQPGIQYEQDRGYEPEGIAGTSTASHASQSGHLSIPQSRGGASMRAGSERKFSDHRISTVPEDEGEYDQSGGMEQPYSPRERMMSPLSPLSDRHRGGSAPLATPPQTSHGPPLSASNENTPRTADSKRHKSKGSSSFFPKISRWSETTASSIGKAFRSSGGSRKQEAPEEFGQHPPSRSGSDLADFDPYQNQDPYGDDKLHTGSSQPNLLPQGMDGHQTPGMERDTPAAMAYATPEDPKYRAHRDSLNLQHPQPRPGQTERFRTALETSAADYKSPRSPRSEGWGGSVTSFQAFHHESANSYMDDNHGTPASARQEYNWGGAGSPSSNGPPRPPKEPLDNHSAGTQTPPPGSRVSQLQKQNPLSHQSFESGYGTTTATHVGSYHSGSPKPENKNLSGALGMPARRPSGPRAMTPSRNEDGEMMDRRRKRDTFGTVASPSSVLSQDSETF